MWTQLDDCGASTCSPELAAGFWQTLRSGISQSEPARLSHSAERSCSPGNAMDGCQGSRFGTTFGHSTGGHGADSLTCLPEGFPAKTSASPGEGPESTVSGVGFGESLRGSFAIWHRDSCSWRTHQRSLDADWEPFSEVWPRWGTMRSGACWALPTPVRRMSARAFGFWRTPQARDGMGGGQDVAKRKAGRHQVWAMRKARKDGQ